MTRFIISTRSRPLVEPFTVFWIVLGALLIAVGASVWPAQRAAHLHPGPGTPV